MENYKIKVNDEAESREAVELFTQLGYGLFRSKHIGLVAVNDDTIYADVIGNWDEYEGKELTLPQLRDLVVLHRNDPKDANVQQDVDVPCLYDLYLTEDKELYFYHCGKGKWLISNLNNDEDYYRVLKPIQKQQLEQGLISGSDALRALADGKEIQWVSTDFKNWNDLDIWNANLKTFLNEKYIAEGEFKFRIKPCTITLNVEIPAPFEPKEGEEFFILAPLSVTGYTKVQGITTQVLLDEYVKLGAWRTEEEIKQVVAALRGGIKA